MIASVVFLGFHSKGIVVEAGNLVKEVQKNGFHSNLLYYTTKWRRMIFRKMEVATTVRRNFDEMFYRSHIILLWRVLSGVCFYYYGEIVKSRP